MTSCNRTSLTTRHAELQQGHRPKNRNCNTWRINEHLARWAMHKFKRFRGKYAKAMAWLQKVYQYKPRLFAHWQLIAFT